MNDTEENKYILANKKLNITKNKIIFIYSAPKVGSTSLVSSFRIFALNNYDIIHIHDEKMLEILKNITDISINDIIRYNSSIGKIVYVIDVYRSPIERKISAFFEKICSYHFNNSAVNINQYNVERIIHRFNNIFLHIANIDYFMDKYEINDLLPDIFPYDKKYIFLEKNNIKYIKLRLKDSNEWNNILTEIFEQPICVIKDYTSDTKQIANLYQSFNEIYRIPENYLNIIMQNKHLNYYYSFEELQEYSNKWIAKMAPNHQPYSEEQYKIYETISIENCYTDEIQSNHYADDGCECNKCYFERNKLRQIILNGKYNGQKIHHSNVKNIFFPNEYMSNKNIATRRMKSMRF